MLRKSKWKIPIYYLNKKWPRLGWTPKDLQQTYNFEPERFHKFQTSKFFLRIKTHLNVLFSHSVHNSLSKLFQILLDINSNDMFITWIVNLLRFYLDRYRSIIQNLVPAKSWKYFSFYYNYYKEESSHDKWSKKLNCH